MELFSRTPPNHRTVALSLGFGEAACNLQADPGQRRTSACCQ
jgi:hypothetical protein